MHELCLSVSINTERHFNTRHLDYRAAMPYKYCSDCYGEFINVILGGRHYSVLHATLSLCCFTEYELLYYQRNKAV